MSSRTRKQQSKRKLAALMVAAMPAMAAQGAEVNLQPIQVSGQAQDDYQVRQSANAKMSQPLLDTPKTVQVISQQVMREQGATTLMEALRNTPGITLQMGENGNTSLGDTFMMRGFSTQGSTFLDGIRDLGGVSRDIFNLEQIEIVKGPSGSDSGRGSASGYINLISKLPTLEDRISGTLAYGTADKKEISADINQQLTASSALRLNLVNRDGGVNGRDVVENKNYAVAPAIGLGLDGPTRLYFYSQHVRQNNIPDGGLPAIGMPGYYNANALISAGQKVDRENFYGSSKDYEDVQADMLTVKLEHDLNDVTTLTNLSRWGRSSTERVLTGTSGTITAVVPNNPATWTVGRSRQFNDQDNSVLANLSSISTQFDTFGLQNNLVAGLELTREQQTVRSGVFAPASPAANLYSPDHHQLLGQASKSGAKNEGDTRTAAIYAFDTLKLNEQWLLNAGVRYEDFSSDYKNRTAAGDISKLDTSDQLFTWNAGVVFKPALNGSIYLSYADSKTPAGNGFTLSSTAGNVNNPSAKPQETRHVELGTKWDVLDERLSLQAALYRTENDNQVTTDEITLAQVQEGKLIVKGVELGVVGRLTDNWQVTAGVAHMKTTQKNQQSVSATGVVTETTGVRWSPELTATLWTTYSLGKLTLGGGARYVDEQKRLVAFSPTTNPATTSLGSLPSYWVADAMAAYQVNQNLSLQLNLYNLFDEDYYEVNNAGSRVRYGEPRSALVTAALSF